MEENSLTFLAKFLEVIYSQKCAINRILCFIIIILLSLVELSHPMKAQGENCVNFQSR